MASAESPPAATDATAIALTGRYDALPSVSSSAFIETSNYFDCTRNASSPSNFNRRSAYRRIKRASESKGWSGLPNGPLREAFRTHCSHFRSGARPKKRFFTGVGCTMSRGTAAVCSEAAVNATINQPTIIAMAGAPKNSTCRRNFTFVRDVRSVTSRSTSNTTLKIAQIERLSSR